MVYGRIYVPSCHDSGVAIVHGFDLAARELTKSSDGEGVTAEHRTECHSGDDIDSHRLR